MALKEQNQHRFVFGTPGKVHKFEVLPNGKTNLLWCGKYRDFRKNERK